MKRKLLTSIFSFILCIAAQAQNPVLNPGFESWAPSSTTFHDEPASWTTNNYMDYLALTKSLIAHTGAYSLRGEVSLQGPSSIIYGPMIESQTSGTGFPVSQLYNYLRFWYRFSPVTGDIVLAAVLIYDASSNPIGGGSLPIMSAASAWTEATVPITYSGSGPATAIITFLIADSGGGTNYHVGSYFLIDDVQLSNTSSINETEAGDLFSVSPNPAINEIRVQSSNLKFERVEVYDMLGQQVYNSSHNSSLTIDVSQWQAGIYFVKVLAGDKMVVKKVVKM